MNERFFDPSIELMDTVKVESEKVHIRIKQRNGKKSITTIEGLHKDLDKLVICKDLRKNLHCNGSVQTVNNVIAIQLFGDQRLTSKKFLIDNSIVAESEIVIHGY